MEFDKILEHRHSVRNYSTKKVNIKDVVKIMNAGRLCPAAGNIQTIRFVLVDDADTKEQLGKAAHKQHFIENAPFIIVVCSELHQMHRAYDERGLRYARQQAGAAIENMLLKTTELGLSSCWIGAFDDNAIRKILKVPKKGKHEIEIEALLPIGYKEGYKDAKKVKRKKFDLDKITYLNTYETA